MKPKNLKKKRKIRKFKSKYKDSVHTTDFKCNTAGYRALLQTTENINKVTCRNCIDSIRREIIS